MNKEIQVKKMFLLWEIMAELESLLWEIYFDQFMEMCIDMPPDPMDGTAANDIAF